MTDRGLNAVATLAKRSSIREEVTLALRAAIVSGEMQPGEIYSAPMLSERFGVSPTPVREGMLDLVKEGLVEPLVNKGFRVTEVSEQDLDNIANLRLLIEPVAMRRATPKVPAEVLPTLRTWAAEIVSTAESGDLARYLEVDRQFHLEILSYAGNALLLEEVARLRIQTRMFGLWQAVENKTLVHSAAEHLQFVDLIERRDAVAVEDLTILHIAHARGIWATSDSASEAQTRERLWVQPSTLLAD